MAEIGDRKNEGSHLWTGGSGLASMPQAVVEALPWTVVERNPIQAELELFDTYDWDLYYAGVTLVRTAGAVHICPRCSCGPESALATQSLEGPFSGTQSDLPDGPVASYLSGAATDRRLLPILRLNRQALRYEMRNSDEKIVLRAQAESYMCPGVDAQSPLQSLLRVCPLRGYDDERRAFEGLLAAAGLQVPAAPDEPSLLGQFCDIPPRDVIRPRFALDPSRPSREAVFTMVQAMLVSMRRYEAGILADVDAECLHQYRVLLRKIRSLLGQLKGVLPRDICDSVRATFASIGRRTNRLRDADVFIMSAGHFRGMLPEALQGGLDAVFAAARRERGLERGRVVGYLRSERYRQTIEELEQIFLDPGALPDSPDADVPICTLARRRIRKRYRRIVNGTRTIAAEIDPDPRLHQLRIQCKKLRYLLGLFGSMFDEDAVALLVKRSRALQNRLGSLHDLTVQQRDLGVRLAAAGSQSLSRQTVASLGGLVGILHQQLGNERRRALRQLQRFRGRRVREAVNALACPHGQETP